MGQLLVKALNSLASSSLQSKKQKILMLGLDAAGKTTILYQLKLSEAVQCVPTIGFNVETVNYKNLKFTIWDIGGQWKLRQLWDYYFKGNNALIYVLDSTDIERMDEAKQALELVLSNDDMKETPVLIFANKQDVAGKISVSDISEKLSMDKMKGVGQWHIQGCCALNGSGIHLGLDWLAATLKEKIKQ